VILLLRAYKILFLGFLESVQVTRGEITDEKKKEKEEQNLQFINTYFKEDQNKIENCIHNRKHLGESIQIPMGGDFFFDHKEPKLWKNTESTLAITITRF